MNIRYVTMYISSYLSFSIALHERNKALFSTVISFVRFVVYHKDTKKLILIKLYRKSESVNALRKRYFQPFYCKLYNKSNEHLFCRTSPTQGYSCCVCVLTYPLYLARANKMIKSW